MRCTVTMERVGRTHRPAPFVVEGPTPDELAVAIKRAVRPMLGSREVDVAVGLPGDPSAVRVYVGGFRDGGSGRISPSCTAFFEPGQLVVYRAPHVGADEPGEEGVVSSTTIGYVFVRFGLANVRACDAASLQRVTS